MAIEKILEEVKKLSPQERKKLLHLIEKENEQIFKEKEPEKSTAALKKTDRVDKRPGRRFSHL